MNVFLDTNFVLEVVMHREKYVMSKQIVTYFTDHKIPMCMSAASFYTMIFLVEKHLKQNLGLIGENKTHSLRVMMAQALKTFSIVEHDRTSLMNAVNDLSFSDLEDSCQYQLSRKSGCTHLVTFNVSDYAGVENPSVEIISPEMFVEKYVNS